MIAAAFDERRMVRAGFLTGGGGIGANRSTGPRNSDTLDIMRKSNPNWFSPHLHLFWGPRESFPFDEHCSLRWPHRARSSLLEGDLDTISLPPR